MAKDCFKQLQLPTTVVELNQRKDGPDIMAALKNITGMTTVCYAYQDLWID